MKSKCIKYVFSRHPVSGRFCYKVLDGSYVFLDEKFSFLRFLGDFRDNYRVTKVIFKYYGSDGVAWIDKHGNAIVRFVNPFVQSKIHF